MAADCRRLCSITGAGGAMVADALTQVAPAALVDGRGQDRAGCHVAARAVPGEEPDVGRAQPPAPSASRAPVKPARVRPGSGGIGRIAIDSLSVPLIVVGQPVFVVADPDVVVAVAAPRRTVEPLIRTPQPVEPARIGRVAV